MPERCTRWPNNASVDGSKAEARLFPSELSVGANSQRVECREYMFSKHLLLLKLRSTTGLEFIDHWSGKRVHGVTVENPGLA